MYSFQSTAKPLDEARWQDHHHFKATTLTGSVRPWLLDQRSLTQRLVNASHGQFSVQVLQQRWQTPRRSEAQLLQMQQREIAIVREVVLLCQHQPWVFARSVIPASAITGRLRRLRKFSNSSLGEMLFKEPNMRREPFQLARIPGQSDQLPDALKTNATLWARRCRFELSGKAIMVSEVFLPAFKL